MAAIEHRERLAKYPRSFQRPSVSWSVAPGDWRQRGNTFATPVWLKEQDR